MSAPTAAIARVSALIYSFLPFVEPYGRESVRYGIVPEKLCRSARFNVGECPFSEIRRTRRKTSSRVPRSVPAVTIGPAVPAMMRVGRISAPVIGWPRVIIVRHAAEIFGRIIERRPCNEAQRIGARAMPLRRPAIVMADAARVSAMRRRLRRDTDRCGGCRCERACRKEQRQHGGNEAKRFHGFVGNALWPGVQMQNGRSF